ncbi:MAG: Na+/H+ antiporter NhaA [Opitutaceae bacterium]
MLTTIKTFIKHESSAGILLFLAAVLALIFANTPLSRLYGSLIDTDFGVQLGNAGLTKPLILWINDGLMAVFFFLVGLELKREILEGELSNRRKLTLPLFAAVGGMLAPACIYVYLNWGDPVALNGWAIPAATDIAFALGILAVLGSRVPVALKVFLVSLAIIDDIGAIAIIALFYTENLSITSLSASIPAIIGLFILNRRKVTSKAPYILLGIFLWVAVLKSGIHATLAGILLATFIPLRGGNGSEGTSPLRELEHALHPWVAFGILPIFAFANSGVSLAGLSPSSLLDPVPLGIMLGLFLGKQFGVFSFSWVAIKLGLAELPDRVRWSGLYGVSLLAGIGFTMSLFIASLAFEETGDTAYVINDRLGIICGSMLSAIAGYLVLYLTSRRPSEQTPDEPA